MGTTLKMATGLTAKAGWIPQVALLVATAAGWWWVWNRFTVDVSWGDPNPQNLLIIFVVGSNVVMTAVAMACEGLRPFAVWRCMTRRGCGGSSQRDIRLWALAAWPLLVPAELVICVVAGANIRLE